MNTYDPEIKAIYRNRRRDARTFSRDDPRVVRWAKVAALELMFYGTMAVAWAVVLGVGGGLAYLVYRAFGVVV
jgi:hypothetical protein